MSQMASYEEILSHARTNNWLKLSASEGNILNVFLTPGGTILEIYFEKNKVTFKVLSYHVCK